MKSATIIEIKRELGGVETERIQELCLRLAKFKKENKELLTYLLFESSHESTYILSAKEDMDELFKALPRGNVYFVKKGLRKILRMVNRQVRYSGIAQTELELRIHYCSSIRNSGVNLQSSAVLTNLYQQQIVRINKTLATLPADLQFDYANEITSLTRD